MKTPSSVVGNGALHVGFLAGQRDLGIGEDSAVGICHDALDSGAELRVQGNIARQEKGEAAEHRRQPADESSWT